MACVKPKQAAEIRAERNRPLLEDASAAIAQRIALAGSVQHDLRVARCGVHSLVQLRLEFVSYGDGSNAQSAHKAGD